MANAPDAWTPPRQGELRTPPHNDEAERSLLGAIFLDNRVIDEVLAVAQPEDLYRESHRHIFRAMSTLHARGEALDVITVADQLASEKLLEAIGGPNMLARLSSEVPSAANASYYATIVSRKASLRNFITTAHALIDECYNDVSDFEAFMDSAESKLFAITQSGAKKGYSTMREVIKEAFAQIEALYQKAEQVTGVPSGFIDLDEITAGWQPSDLIIIAARPAMGKCLSAQSEVLLSDGRLMTMAQLHERKQAEVASLNDSMQLVSAQVSDFIDDGKKPVFEVTTRSGRRVEVTAVHPLLTMNGWRPLHEIAVGEPIAVPRQLPFFGTRQAPDAHVKLCAYLIGDGTNTGSLARFTQVDPVITQDFMDAVQAFGGLTTTISPDASRAPTYRVVYDRDAVRRAREQFAQQLRGCLQRVELTQRELAYRLGVSPASVTLWRQGKSAPTPELFAALAQHLEVLPTELASAADQALLRPHDTNPLKRWLEEIGLWGCTAHEKHIPDFVFQLPRPQLATFLNRLFATDGWATQHATGQIQVGYASASERLTRQVSHLLLRFGVLSQLRQRATSRRPAWVLTVTHGPSLRCFAEEIGILSKEKALDTVLSRTTSSHVNHDVIPSAVFHRIEALKGAEGWSSLARRAQLRSTQLHPYKRGLSRSRLASIAQALQSVELHDLAHSDVLWDPIVSIKALGPKQVYDLTVPAWHNFIAQDVCVHNTAMTLNMAAHAAIERKVPIAYFSLEMSNVQLAIRMLCSEARIDQSKLRTGRMTEQEWARLIKAAGTLSEAPIFLDDTPALPIMEFRSKARLLKAEHNIGIIFIDYLQLMKAKGSNIGSREQEISEISRNLKGIAKELKVPVIAMAQLNRGVESRADKRPMNSDLRECVTGETLVQLADGTRAPIATLVGHTPHVWAVDEQGQCVTAQSDKVWPVGEREVFRMTLATGRTLTATAKHRVLTGGGWRELSQLTSGSRIALARQLPAQAHLTWDEVTSIEPAGSAMVYDLTVPGPASWLANDGIVSHNSGAIEQDADIISFIYRDEVYNPESEHKGIAEFILGKHRNGGLGTVRLRFFGQYTRFENLAPEIAEALGPVPSLE